MGDAPSPKPDGAAPDTPAGGSPPDVAGAAPPPVAEPTNRIADVPLSTGVGMWLGKVVFLPRHLWATRLWKHFAKDLPVHSGALFMLEKDALQVPTPTAVLPAPSTDGPPAPDAPVPAPTQEPTRWLLADVAQAHWLLTPVPGHPGLQHAMRLQHKDGRVVLMVGPPLGLTRRLTRQGTAPQAFGLLSAQVALGMWWALWLGVAAWVLPWADFWGWIRLLARKVGV